jgi:hypothetical protein
VPVTSRVLTEIPDANRLEQIRTSIGVSSEISYQFIEQGVHAPVITFWRKLGPEQELLLDLILANYLYYT